MTAQIIQEKATEYFLANVTAKTDIVTSICRVTGMHRKSVIRALARAVRRRSTNVKPRLGRPRIYSAETDAALAFIWEHYDYPAAERLHGEISEAVRIFQRDAMWHYGTDATNSLLTMSLGAMKLRTTAMARARGLMRGYSTTTPSKWLRVVPVFFGDWSKKNAGYGQVDTVVHSGPKLMGTMAYTVNFVDVATYWQEPVAQLDKSGAATRASLQAIYDRLPWRMNGIHPDSGSEFINELGLGWCGQRRVEMTRSRPSKKNDNCYVEQRNLVVVRKYVGYSRYDCAEAVAVMNELYQTLRLYLNYFQPTFKLQGKERGEYVQNGIQASRTTKRIYDTPKTPFKRALERDDIHQHVKEKLQREYESLNPKVLRAKIQALQVKLERTQREQGYHY